MIQGHILLPYFAHVSRACVRISSPKSKFANVRTSLIFCLSTHQLQKLWPVFLTDIIKNILFTLT